jgi:hypothetical protein
MVRHRRSEVALRLPPRLAETLLVTPSVAEAELYAEITARIRAVGRDASAAMRLTSADDAEFAGRLDAIGDDLARARTDCLHSRGKVDALVGGSVESDVW